MKVKAFRLWLEEPDEDGNGKFMQASSRETLYEDVIVDCENISKCLDLKDVPELVKEVEIEVEAPFDMNGFVNVLNDPTYYWWEKEDTEVRFFVSTMSWNVRSKNSKNYFGKDIKAVVKNVKEIA